MTVLGLSCWYHDAAAAVVRDGEIVAAAQEERFTRTKHDPGFPTEAVRYCLDEAGLGLDAIDSIVFYDKPFLKFERLLENLPVQRRTARAGLVPQGHAGLARPRSCC